MPPTDVFRALGASEEDEVEDEDGEKIDIFGPALGLESILDLYQAQLPSEMLRWHYRSMHQQLIAFSNEYFYEGALIVPPSRWHENPDLGIKRHFVENGRLQDRKNPAEVEQVIALMREHVLERSHESLGVVAMNSDQQSLIQDQWEAACKGDEVLEEMFTSFNEGTKLFIRNLENVQGDERDVIIISTNYAKNAAGEMFQRFGPINKAGGQRRLNVLFTRARKRIHLVTSLVHTDIQPSTSANDSGRGFFRKYLQFVETGHLPDSGGGAIKTSPDSAFEVSVAQCISSLGFDLHYQVGVQGFFIDIGVLHPDGDRYLCGIECDGAAYHSHPIARDRDGIRQEILERRGWNIYRIWSTDWFRNRTLEIERLRNHLAQMVHRV
jgi:very-short-patch-repair endonuclease